MLKRSDFYFIGILIVLFLPFILSDQLFYFYKDFNHAHGLITSFIKFALLATLGETLGARIRTGQYIHKYFGIIPRMLAWGFIGITVKMSFIIFSVGTPAFLEYAGYPNASEALSGSMDWDKVFVAFSTSVALNIIYAPVMMTFHKITDMHIHYYKGRLKALISPIDFRKIFVILNWSVQWNFVFKKTIPLFWIPAHTITFLLNPDYQVLFAAFLSVVLGAILAVADLMDSPSIEKQLDLNNS